VTQADDLADLEGSAAAPPRENGELVFDEPWQMRAFGVAADLVDAGHFSWRDFQHELIRAIGEWESTPESERADWAYYDRWMVALERLVHRAELLVTDELDDRSAAYAARPHGHDH